MNISSYTRNELLSELERKYGSDENNKRNGQGADLDIFNEGEKKQIRSDWQAFKNILTDHKINLYHFTDKSNLDSIRSNGGLFSWYYCETNNIHIPEPGGDELSRKLDLKKGLEDYVRISFNCKHPMLYVAQGDGRMNNPVFLEIDSRIIYLNPILFSNMNATDNRAKIGSSIEDFQQIKFGIVRFKWDNELEKKYFQAEILVKTSIPSKFIKNLQYV